MKYSEINNLQPQELKKRLDQTRQALFEARMKHKMQRLSNMMEIRHFRRDIARLETAVSVLPESAFVFKKKPVKDDAKVLEKKPAKSVSEKARLKKKDKPKKIMKETILREDSKIKANEEKQDQKKASKKKASKEKASKEKVPLTQQELEKSAQDKSSGKAVPRKRKWLGFFGSKQKSSKTQQSGGKRGFFRRKSG